MEYQKCRLHYDIFEDPKTSNIYDGYVIELEVEENWILFI